MINRPMLLNLFKKASAPKLPDDTVLRTVGIIPVINFNVGTQINLKPTEMLRAIRYHNEKKITEMYADFYNNSHIRTDLVVMRISTSTKLWSILLPKDSTTQTGAYDVYTQTNATSAIFKKQ